MKLEVEKNSPSLHPNGKLPKFCEDAIALTDHVEMLNYGIRSAQAGNRCEARTALFRVTESDPANETAWLWLASISEYPEELLVFLNNVLQINPTNERAREWKVATNSLLAKTFVQRGIDAVEGDRKDFAAECFNRALEYDQNNEMAWLWMASLAETNEGKLTYLEMVLKIDPNNEAALQAFNKAKTEITDSHLSSAKLAAALGQKAEATELLNAVIEEDPACEDAWMLRSHFADTFEEKIASFEKVLEINPDNAAAKFSLDSLRSLMGTSPSVEPEPSVNLQNSLGSISGSNLFAYEPEIDRNPTQELEMPTEKIEEFREFAARNGNGFAHDTPPVEQPIHEFVEQQPVQEFVEQPVPLAEQTDEPETVVEFEVAPAESPETEEPAESKVVEEAKPSDDFPSVAETPFLENIADSNGHSSVETETQSYFFGPTGNASFNVVDNDPSISVATAETFVSQNNETTKFSFDEEKATDKFAFSAENSEPATGESHKTETFDTETAVPQPSFDEEFADSPVPKPEEITGSNNGFHSEQIVIEASAETPTTETDDDPFKTVASLSIPMPEYSIPEPRPENNPFAATVEAQYVRTSVTSAPSVSNCSFCDAANESSSISCRYCLAVLTLSDLEMIIGNHHADRMVLKAAVERMDNERKIRDFDEAELTMLGIGHLNLQNLQFGYNYLYEASKLNPNNVVLSSQVNALLIRLEDIRKHDETANTMSKGKTILVVDDSPTVRKLIAGKLEKSGHNVFCSADGVEAIEMLAGMKPDLILLDINMPRMDGYQTCKSIRSKDVTKDIPVVMISGKDGFFDKVRGRMAGTTGYITKPFGPETLMKTVETYLSGNGEEAPEVDIEIEA